MSASPLSALCPAPSASSEDAAERRLFESWLTQRQWVLPSEWGNNSYAQTLGPNGPVDPVSELKQMLWLAFQGGAEALRQSQVQGLPEHTLWINADTYEMSHASSELELRLQVRKLSAYTDKTGYLPLVLGLG